MATKTIAVTTPVRDGQRLAIVMLRELEASPELCDKSYLPEAWSPAPSWAHDNIVLRYLNLCRERGGADAEAGFCSVLSDIVANISEEFCPSATRYTGLLKIQVPGRVSAKAKKLRVLKGISRIVGRAVTEEQLDAAAERARSLKPA